MAGPLSARMNLEAGLGRLLMRGTYLSIALVGLGVAGMVLGGRSPLEPGIPPFDPARLPADLGAGRAEGFLWLGIVVVVATPATRVAAALIGYVVRGERTMATVSAAVLAVIALGIVLALGTG